MRTINLQFSVLGYCDQAVELAEDCEFTREQIEDGLNGSGDQTICTTVQEGGELIVAYPTGDVKVLGKVIESNMDGEYLDFDCIEDET